MEAISQGGMPLPIHKSSNLPFQRV